MTPAAYAAARAFGHRQRAARIHDDRADFHRTAAAACDELAASLSSEPDASFPAFAARLLAGVAKDRTAAVTFAALADDITARLHEGA